MQGISQIHNLMRFRYIKSILKGAGFFSLIGPFVCGVLVCTAMVLLSKPGVFDDGFKPSCTDHVCSRFFVPIRRDAGVPYWNSRVRFPAPMPFTFRVHRPVSKWRQQRLPLSSMRRALTGFLIPESYLLLLERSLPAYAEVSGGYINDLLATALSTLGNAHIAGAQCPDSATSPRLLR
jgi:hypothetical protein